MSHTPGPWTASRSKSSAFSGPQWNLLNGMAWSVNKCGVCSDTKTGEMIGTICETLAVTMPTYKEHDMRAEADAKLMAAAPDMRAALIEACKFIQKHNEEFAPTEDLDLTDEEREELGEWMESCEAVLKQCQSALAKTEGRDF